MKKTILAAALALGASIVLADDFAAEWRVLGPAASYHSSLNGAQVRTLDAVWSCFDETRTGVNGDLLNLLGQNTVSSGQSFKTTNPASGPHGVSASVQAALGSTAAASGQNIHFSQPGANVIYYAATTQPTNIGTVTIGGRQYNLVTYKYAQCYSAPAGTEKRWQQRNPALGLELTQRYSTYSNKFFITAVKDSYGSSSLMLGAGRFLPLVDGARLKIDGGFVGGVWWRTTLGVTDQLLARETVPLVLPSLSISDMSTGLGVNIGFAPRASYRGRIITPTAVAMLQTSWLLHKSESGSTAVSAQINLGRVSATLEKLF